VVVAAVEFLLAAALPKPEVVVAAVEFLPAAALPKPEVVVAAVEFLPAAAFLRPEVVLQVVASVVVDFPLAAVFPKSGAGGVIGRQSHQNVSTNHMRRQVK
jgi:hypothetical protein